MRGKFLRILAIVMVVVAAFSFVACSKPIADYNSAEELEAALNDGEDCEGKIAVITVDTYKPDGSLGYTIWSGEHLNFISSNNPKVNEGDEITVRITSVQSMLGSWIIKYEKV